MSNEWYYAQNNQKLGPVSIAELCRLAGRSQLLPTDMVMQAGTGKWLPAREVKGLFPFLNNAAAVQAPGIPLPVAPAVAQPSASSIPFRCPACRAQQSAPREQAGAFVQCRACGTYLQVPQPS